MPAIARFGATDNTTLGSGWLSTFFEFSKFRVFCLDLLYKRKNVAPPPHPSFIALIKELMFHQLRDSRTTTWEKQDGRQACNRWWFRSLFCGPSKQKNVTTQWHLTFWPGIGFHNIFYWIKEYINFIVLFFNRVIAMKILVEEFCKYFIEIINLIILNEIMLKFQFVILSKLFSWMISTIII